MANESIEIQAKDCLRFETQDNKAIIEFINRHKDSTIPIFSKKNCDESPIAYYDNSKQAWIAGRYVGESVFTSNGNTYKIKIVPRFGNPFLFHLLEEVFNVRFNETLYSPKSIKTELLIKRIISFIWLQKLAKANQYGFPRMSKAIKYSGSMQKGRISVRDSIIKIKTKKEVVSIRNEKCNDKIIFNIINQAYLILKKDYSLGTFNIPENVSDVIHHFDRSHYKVNSHIVTEQEYKSIRYKSIYNKFREIVDFSWFIIKNKANIESGNSKKKGYSCFIDIAELWEVYIRSLLKRHFTPKGYHISSDEFTIYQDKFYERKLIPDILIKTPYGSIVLDAKYKNMDFKQIDFDREDFFQIHTYAGAVSKRENLCGVGLIYPLKKSIERDNKEKLRQNSLYFPNLKDEPFFLCDGIYIPEEITKEKLKSAEQEFCNRIESLFSEFLSIP